MRTSRWAVRLATNHFDHRSDSIDGQSRLHRCTVLVTIAYIALTIACFKLAAIEGERLRASRKQEVHFVLTNEPLAVAPKPPVQTTNDQNHSAKVIASSLKSFFTQESSALMIKPPLQNSAKPQVNSTVQPIHTIDAALPIAITAIALNRGGVNNPMTGPILGIAAGAGAKGELALSPVDTTTDFSTPPPIAMGNIRPWRQEVLKRIGQTWRQQNNADRVVVVLKIARDGTLLDSEVISSDNPATNDAVLKALQQVQFPPTPDWYKGKQITYKLTLTPNEAPPLD